jgi:hypothetical protein
MPDLDQIKQGEQGARDRRGRFPKGWSGPPRRYHGCVKRDEVGNVVRFAVASLQKTAASATPARPSFPRSGVLHSAT